MLRVIEVLVAGLAAIGAAVDPAQWPMLTVGALYMLAALGAMRHVLRVMRGEVESMRAEHLRCLERLDRAERALRKLGCRDV